MKTNRIIQSDLDILGRLFSRRGFRGFCVSVLIEMFFALAFAMRVFLRYRMGRGTVNIVLVLFSIIAAWDCLIGIPKPISSTDLPRQVFMYGLIILAPLQFITADDEFYTSRGTSIVGSLFSLQGKVPNWVIYGILDALVPLSLGLFVFTYTTLGYVLILGAIALFIEERKIGAQISDIQRSERGSREISKLVKNDKTSRKDNRNPNQAPARYGGFNT